MDFIELNFKFLKSILLKSEFMPILKMLLLMYIRAHGIWENKKLFILYLSKRFYLSIKSVTLCII